MLTMGRKPITRKHKLGARLVELRRRQGLTQADAAAKVRVTSRTWQMWEAGHRKPDAGHLFLIDLLDQGKI